MTTEAVVLDVSVLDPDGRPVRGLSAADFTVLEDGRRQVIATFAAVDLPDAEETSVPWLREVSPDVRRNDELTEGRVVVLVLDDCIAMSPQASLRVPQYARQVIEGLGSGDLAAVVFVAHKRSGQEFTRDRARLLAAAERYRGASPIGGRSLPSALETLAPRMVIDTLREVANGLADLPQRRKALIYVSAGVPVDFEKAAPHIPWEEMIETGEVQTVIGQLVDLFDAARRANVNVYCLDPVGLSPIDPPSLKLGREFMQTVSGNTGGFTITQTNDPKPGIMQIYRENGSYYVIGYQPSNERAEGRFRRIEVRVNRPGLRVRTRSGYFEPRAGKPTTGTVRAASASDALAGFVPKGDVPLAVIAAPFAVKGRAQAALAIVLGFLPPTPGEATAAREAGQEREDVEVVVRAYAETGDLRASEHLNVQVKGRPDARIHGPYEVLSRLDVKPGRYHLRLGAQAGGRSGSVYCDVDVPDFANSPLSLSGLVLSQAPGITAAPRDRLAPVIPVVPTARREFWNDEQVTAFLRVYQGGKHPLWPAIVAARVTDSRGVTVVDTAEAMAPKRFAAGRAADYRLDLPLESLKPGPHLLTIAVTASTVTAERHVRFEVRPPLGQTAG